MTDIEYINFPNILQDKINGIILHSGTNNNKHLSKFIKYFCNMYKSSGFMSAGMYYRRHELWEIAALSANKSFFCLHREGVGVDYNSLKNNFQQLFNSARKFKGTMLFVATHSLKKFLVDNNYYKNNEVVVTGVPRFDKIYNNSQRTNTNNKILVFFSFFLGTLESDELYPKHGGFRDFFYSVHGVIANYALNNPEVKVYIKPKWYTGDAKMYIDSAISKAVTSNISDIKNLYITDKIPAHDLITKASTIVSFNSTTLVESMLYGKKVIMPKYFEASKNYNKNVYYSDYPNVFYYPDSPDSLLDVIDNCINDTLPSKDIDFNFVKDVAGSFDGLICNRIESQIKKYI